VERDEGGKFVKGNPGGPGRLPRAREDRYLEITMQTVTFDDWRKIVEKAARQAMAGDAKAREWLSGYLVGKPEENSNHEVEITIKHTKQGI
jgi:hypothetical protein